jgi:hypothetical protein
MIRDHIDCGVPYLHELIAFVAQSEGDDVALETSRERMREFGPLFADWESKWDAAGFSQALANATVGLSLSFGIEINPHRP